MSSLPKAGLTLPQEGHTLRFIASTSWNGLFYRHCRYIHARPNPPAMMLAQTILVCNSLGLGYPGFCRIWCKGRDRIGSFIPPSSFCLVIKPLVRRLVFFAVGAAMVGLFHSRHEHGRVHGRRAIQHVQVPRAHAAAPRAHRALDFKIHRNTVRISFLAWPA